jgi:hypothetical protein
VNITLKKDGVPLIGKQWGKLKGEVLAEIRIIIARIEEEVGPRDNTYSLTINFNSQKAIVTEVDEIKKTVIINLPTYVMENDDEAVYQRKLNLSHELVHTITPCPDPSRATFLDEGLAVVFSERYTGCESCPVDQRYIVARNLVLSLLNIRSDIIKQLREKQPDKKMSNYTIQDILENILPRNLRLVETLTKCFYKT